MKSESYNHGFKEVFMKKEDLDVRVLNQFINIQKSEN